MTTHAHVLNIRTEMISDRNYVDLIQLKDGRVLGISSDLIVLYENEDDFWECPSDAKTKTIYLVPEDEV